MMLFFRCVIVIFTFFCSGFASAKQPINFLGKVENAHIGQLYFSDFMHMLWQAPELADNYELREIAAEGYRTQRKDILLKRKIIDINWAGAEKRFNKEAIKVPLPVVGGLLGYRIALIRNEDAERFSATKTLHDLKVYKACQGESWLDADILEFNDIPVIRVSNTQSMAKMLAQGRCDMFPRGIQEAKNEIASYQADFPGIRLNESVLMQYDFASYLYVRKTDVLLANRLESAFRSLIQSGQYRELLEKHDYTRHIFPLSKWKNARFINLHSPEPDPDRTASPNYLNLAGD